MRVTDFTWRGPLVLVATLLLPSALVAQGAAPAKSGPAGDDGKPLYKVVDGYKVDPETMKGFRAWRAAACDRCHGANQEGLVGPSLIESLKTLTKDQFKTTVTEGRLDKGMVSFKTSPIVMENLDHLYAYLKGRSNGDITRAKVEEIQP
jgi:mono/diheme cytochrome c family protein